MATLCLNLTIQVLNLSPATTSDDLIDFFSYCGMVENVKLLPPRCKDDKEGSQSAALVTFRQPYAFKTALLLNKQQKELELVSAGAMHGHGSTGSGGRGVAEQTAERISLWVSDFIGKASKFASDLHGNYTKNKKDNLNITCRKQK
ncbi:protein vip1 isoform X3 [Cannabis sativa]|uniref:protein vip1 isoform X3 n=1 Tax=Cannabis sativa TaxID=3483 RepID=UPI0029CA2A7B|nr:protein vip1 isoform X3 [Cannabis sativa]